MALLLQETILRVPLAFCKRCLGSRAEDAREVRRPSAPSPQSSRPGPSSELKLP